MKKIDIVEMFNKILVVIELLNIILCFINLFILSSTLLTINWTVNFIALVFNIAEIIAVRHNDKVIKKLYGFLEFK